MVFQLADVIWTDVWAQTGMGFGVVFCILVLLVFVLVAFGSLASKAVKKSTAPKETIAPLAELPSGSSEISASDADKAAIATALYLFYQNVHDEESDVLTIRHTPHSAWHRELNNHFN